MKLSCNQHTLLAIFSLLFLFTSCKKDFDPGVNTAGDESSALASRSKKPNIILIIADDVGREIPTYNGGESYSTPNLDFLAANGMQFPYFFSHPDGPCSRLALVTGKYNYRNWTDFGYLPPDQLTFANMLHDAGYATCFTGKWQFDGGDTSIKQHGFDKYLVFQPFNPRDNNGHNQFYRRYKDPYLYENGRYLTSAEVEGKYSEDMFFDYASNFIDSNTRKPFLLVYSHNLVQKPWVPTPDDPEFASWNPATDDDTKFDRKYFPSMVSYMDKIIGKIIDKVKADGLMNNTVIMFVSDNATHKTIDSKYKGQIIGGAKDSTTFDGINVPFLVYARGKIAAGSVDTSLVDMTDFFPTIANMVGLKTNIYKPLDGTTFYDNLRGTPVKQRSTVFAYWPKPKLSYVFDYNYKLYDSTHGGYFYNWRNDIYEQHPIPDNQLTPAEKQIKDQFQQILVNAHN